MTIETELNDYEIDEALKMLGHQKSIIVRTSGFGRYLLPHLNYRSDKVLVIRRTVDELDNLHIERIVK